MLNSCPIPLHGHAIDCGFVDLGYFKIIILGIVQGITELLPISSTAHMRIVPSLLGWTDPGTPFSGAAQLASFFAVMIYFKKEIFSIFSGTCQSIVKRNFSSHEFKLGLGIILGTIPVGVAGLLLKSTLNAPGTPFRSIYVIGTASIIMGLLLIYCEKFSKPTREFSQITLKDAILVGLAQMLALIPGVSRSGATLTAGFMLGLKRETAAAYSFILGVPVITLAGLHEIVVLHKAGLTLHGWSVLIVGLITASIAAFAAVFGLLRYLEKHNTYVFAWYRVLVGIGLIAGAVIGILK
ncbi:MAG: undecaprenyl-diphosphatase UppP [Bdellovibrionota bacterium]